MSAAAPCPKLLRAVDRWRQALRLQDWQLSLRAAEPGELEKLEKVATVEIFASQRAANIVLRAVDTFNAELERDLVHELLHLVFAQFSMWVSEGRPLDALPLEQGIEAVTHCLVDLRRRSA